ncbi:MAG: beta strand repeat-containing protein, partial [Acidithiobacillus sp.]|uniref:beta strand repeat-containing protein n=1 Tax=Acidithiobacillus sp. TaxID=1872118 RepID=UPI003D06CC88
TAVSLNLGATTTAPFDAYALSVLANGNIANQGDLTAVTNGTFQWINGTLTNTGQIDFGNQGTSSALIPTTTPATLGFQGSSYNLYGNTSQAQSAGGFVNASTGLVNGGSFSFTGASFDNEGTIQMGQSSSTAQPYFDVLAFSGNVDVNGSVNVVGASGYTGSTYLGGVSITANTVAGQNINVGVPLTVNGQGNSYFADVYLDASGNVVTNKAISVSGDSYGNYVTIDAGDYNSLNASSASITVNGPISVSGGLSYYDGIYLQAPGDINVNGALSAIGNGTTYITAQAGYISNTSYGPGVLNISAPITVQAGGMSGASSTQYGYLMLSGANGVNVNAPVSMSVLPSSTETTATATAYVSINALHGSLNTGTSGSISVSALASASGYNTATLETDYTDSFIAANNVNLGAPINLNVSATGGSGYNDASLYGTILPVNGSGSVTIGTGASIGVNVLASGASYYNEAEFTLNKDYSPATPTITGTNVYAPITVNVTASGSDTSNYADMTGFGLNGGIGNLLLASGAPLTVNVSATSPSNAIHPDNAAYFSGGMGAAQTVTLNAPVNINVTASPSVYGSQQATASLNAAATNMYVNQSLDMDAASGGFDFFPVGGRNGSVQQGVFSVASGAMLMAPKL